MQRSERPTRERTSSYALIASAIAGGAESIIFHPADVAKNTIQNHAGRLWEPNKSVASNIRKIKAIITGDTIAHGFLQTTANYFRGVVPAFIYRVTTRFSYALQNDAAHFVDHAIGAPCHYVMGDKQGAIFIGAAGGALATLPHFLLTPFERIKMLLQNQPQYCREQGGIKGLIQDQKWQLYKGTIPTVLRNSLGLFTQFFIYGQVMEYAYAVNKHQHASHLQIFVASTLGAFFSVSVTNVIDVWKTCMQSRSDGKHIGFIPFWADKLKEEGPRALIKGQFIRYFFSVPKFTFTMAATKSLTKHLEARAEERERLKSR